ncbi:MAG: glycosyltransferase family 4 protein, partial [Gemmatimonadota bacterium]
LPDAEVRVLAPAVPGDRAFDRAAGADIRRLGAARLGRTAWMAELASRTVAACLTWRPDLVVCGHVITAPAALLARRLTGVPYAVFVYAYEIRRKRRQRPIARLLRGARMVIACSEFTRQQAVDLGVAREHTRVLYPGVDAKRFTPSSNGAGPARAPTLLSVSRLADMYKGHDTAIRSLALVRAKVPNARYAIAGGGPLRDYLARVADSLGVAAAVEFLGDVPDAALSDVYRSADVLLTLSRESGSGGGAEGFGIVCLEAAACGVPVVAGRSGGLPDAVEDGVTGVLVDPTNIGAAADAIVSLLTDPGRARAMGEAGRKRVLEGFTWERMAQEARRIFAEAV